MFGTSYVCINLEQDLINYRKSDEASCFTLYLTQPSVLNNNLTYKLD